MTGGLFLGLFLVPMLIGIFGAVACALLGNFLILRKQALIGDAISHVVLPGIVVAFLWTGSMQTFSMLVGAAGAALVAVVLIEIVRHAGRVETGAAIGVVFTSLFALGVVLLEQTSIRNIHFDVEHALYGNLESLIWVSGLAPGALFDSNAYHDLPVQLPRLVLVLALVVAFLFLTWRTLVASTFDPVFSRTAGLPVFFVNGLFIVLVAMAAVAAFEAVGAIVTIAMLICPPAAARLMTDNLLRQIAWSVFFAVFAGLFGFWLAGPGVALLVEGAAVSAAGMIATVSGLVLAVAAIAGPRRKGLRS